MKEIRRRAVSDPTDGFSEEISSHYLFIDRLDSFNLSEPTGLFCTAGSIHTLQSLSIWCVSCHANYIIDRRLNSCNDLLVSLVEDVKCLQVETSPQAKRHKLSLLFTSLTSLTFITI